MVSSPELIFVVLAPFADMFSKPVWQHVHLVSDQKWKAEAFFSTDLEMDSKRIIELFVMRWSEEVTFEEAHRYLGMETQRQWSDKAIARTTPAILAIFSIISLVAFRLVSTIEMPLRSSA